MAEHRISRAAVIEAGGVCFPGVAAFDEAARRQGHGEPDLIYPDGWTRADRDRVKRNHPLFFAWLLAHEFIPATPVDEVEDA